MLLKPYAEAMISRDHVFRDIAEHRETVWVNDKYLPFAMTDALCQMIVSDEDIADAQARLRRFSSYIKSVFQRQKQTRG